LQAEDLVRQNQLPEALAALQEQVRADPASVKLRVFLFELLSLLGDWDRAGKQLAVLKDLDASTLALVHTYQDGLLCEKLRAQVFAGATSPLVFGEPSPWVAGLVESLKLQANNASLSRQLAQAYEEAPALSGTLNGDPFEWIADADARLGPVLELIVNGKYYWVPFSRIQKIHIEEPENLRDKVWMPANFIWSNGGEGFGLIPTRYVGSEQSEQANIRSAGATDWQEIDEGMYTGLGQRVLATDANDYPIMDVRDIVIDAPEA
jgi:type VI secretion system protein ImpE